MPRQRIHDAAAVHVENSGPITEGASESGTYGTPRESHQLSSGTSRKSRRGKCRPKRCTVRKTLKLSPQHSAWLDELATESGTTGCAFLKGLLIGAYLKKQARQ